MGEGEAIVVARRAEAAARGSFARITASNYIALTRPLKRKPRRYQGLAARRRPARRRFERKRGSRPPEYDVPLNFSHSTQSVLASQYSNA